MRIRIAHWILAALLVALAVGLILLSAADAGDDPVVLLEDRFDTSPWLPNGWRDPDRPMLLSGAWRRDKLANQGLASYEIEDLGRRRAVVMRWDFSTHRTRSVFVRLRVNPKVGDGFECHSPHGGALEFLRHEPDPRWPEVV